MNRRPTIIDVAKRAGVSKSTVSRVISGDGANVSEAARQCVMEAIAELGYERNAVASSLRTNQTNIIMLAIPDITNPFWPEVARGVQDLMDSEGYAVVFANSDWEGRREKAFLRMAQTNRFDAILINPVEVTSAELTAAGIPTVIIGSRTDYPQFDSVGSDSYGGTCLALEHLYQLGHRRIGLIRGQRRDRQAQRRLDAYSIFLREKGLPEDERLVVEVPFDQAGGHYGMQRLLELDAPPTAIFAANDLLALGALQAAHERGLHVPDALSIVGMDDIYAASAAIPPLTTVQKPKYEIGQKAAVLLLDRLFAEVAAPVRRHLFDCRLLVRGSTAPPPTC